METRRISEIKAIYEQVADLHPDERESVLNEQCGDNHALRSDVIELLEMGDQGTLLLERSHTLAGSLTDAVMQKNRDDCEPEFHIGQQIGPYELKQCLGSGGMGIVYMAEQTEPVRRQVALKLFYKRAKSQLSAQLLSEIQALVMMNHSYIAKVYDTGIARNGLPYFAMELLDGTGIDSFCDAQSLSIKQRLRLFVRVCSGIAHAHQKGIIHRDIKPSNILVSTVEGEPIPKIIDFGIAKSVDGDAHTQLFDDEGSIVGTPIYMSPEQIEKPDEVDTRSDVYALGVLLYEILVGIHPYKADAASFFGILYQVMEGQSETLTNRFESLHAEQKERLARNRQMAQRSLVRVLRGDLGSIVQKAKHPDREERYGSIVELAHDIRLWLEGKPVNAHVSSSGYRISKFIRKHWIAALAITISSLSILLGLLFSVRGYFLAVDSSRQAQEVSQFLTDMLASADPESHGKEVRVIDILDFAAREIPHKFHDDPEVAAKLHLTLGETYNQLGRYELAWEQLEQAVVKTQLSYGDHHRETLMAQLKRARVMKNQARYDDAQKAVEEIIKVQSKNMELDDHDLIQARIDLANIVFQKGDVEAAKSILLSLQQHWASPENRPRDSTYLTVRNNLARIIEREGRFQESAEIYRDVLDQRMADLGPEHPRTLVAKNNLALVYGKLSRLDEAEQLHQQVLEARQRVLGGDHPHTLASMNNLALVYLFRREFEEGEALLRVVHRKRSDILGPEHNLTLNSLRNLMTALAAQKRLDEAEQTCRELLETERRVNGPDDHHTLLTQQSLGIILGQQRHFEEALDVHQDVLQRAMRVLAPTHWRIHAYREGVGNSLVSLERYAEAEGFLRTSFEGFLSQMGPTHRRTRTAAINLTQLYRKWPCPQPMQQLEAWAEANNIKLGP